MKKLTKTPYFFLVFVFLFSCLSQSGDEYKKIKEMESKLKENRQDAKLAVQLDYSYRNYIRKYPEDTIVPHFLFEDAQVNIYPLNKTDAALNQLNIIYTKYPNYAHASDAMFKSAYLNEKLGRFDKAKSLYLLFANTYPGNELASQARTLAGMTGLSEEEQLKQVIAKRNLVQDSIKNQKKVQK